MKSEKAVNVKLKVPGHDNFFGPAESRKEVMRRIQEQEEVYTQFQKLTDNLQEEFVSFCMGVRLSLIHIFAAPGICMIHEVHSGHHGEHRGVLDQV